MRKFSVIIIFLIGLYTLLKGNIIKIEDQVLWSTNSLLFHGVFVPFFMVITSFLALLKKDKNYLFFLALFSMLIDVILRLAIAVNHFYQYMVYTPMPMPEPSEGVHIIIINLIPSHIMGLIELVVVFLFFKYVLKSLKIEINS